MPSRVPVLYQDRDSVIHRRDARVKIVLFGLLLRSGLDKFDFGDAALLVSGVAVVELAAGTRFGLLAELPVLG
jgi:hypothetical protein